MKTLVLVTYATRYGSTKEVAEAIASTLSESGLEVAIQPLAQVRSLEGYQAVVLGAPLYIGAWSKDVLGFLSNYQEAIQQRPVAVFALGPLSNEAQERQGSRTQLDKELAKFPWFSPVAIEIFAGKYDPARLRFSDKLLTILPASPLKNIPARDERDWTAIHTWASALAAKLEPALQR